ncbi:MAG: DUF4087 domain-containing protein [Sphingomonadales bacterium]|nr:MAG: DUF4087 domain-containing protein [Sphingomonadales bacterium]
MRHILIASAFAAAFTLIAIANAEGPTDKPVNICGWIENPTPANWWITDRFGQWVMMTQGSEGVPGMDRIPDLSGKQWVRTNGYYGYGCGCLRATVNREEMEITRIHGFTQKPLSACRADKKLRRPDS